MLPRRPVAETLPAVAARRQPGKLGQETPEMIFVLAPAGKRAAIERMTNLRVTGDGEPPVRARGAPAAIVGGQSGERRDS